MNRQIRQNQNARTVANSRFRVFFACFAVSLLPLFLRAASAPEKRLDIDINWQQLQPLEDLSLQQGASMNLAIRPKLQGQWPTLTDWTARWEARSNLTATTCYQATSTWTSNATHTIAIDLGITQTGTPITNWIYSIILVYGGLDYPIGTGLVNIAQSGFTGSASTVVTNGTAIISTDPIYLAAITNLADTTELTWAGSSHTKTGTISSLITRDTELVSATQAIAVAYASADVVALGVATNSFAPISVTIQAASNAAMAGATATFLPLDASKPLTGMLIASNNMIAFAGSNPSEGFFGLKTTSASGSDDNAIGITPMDQFETGRGAYSWWLGSDHHASWTIPDGSQYNILGKTTSQFIWENVGYERILQTTNRAVIVGSAAYVADDGLSATTIWEGGTALASKYAARTWDIDATIAATNQPSWSLCRKAARSSNVSITSVNAQSYYGTGTWMICQGASPSSWATSGTYTASTTGDTAAVSITWTAGNNLYFVLLPLQCSDYPTNTIFPHAEGTY